MLYRITKDPLGFLFIFIMAFTFWLLISASFDWQHILAGTVIAFLLTFLWAETVFVKEKATGFSLKQAGGLIYYICCLIMEIVIANFYVAYQVLHPKLPISPGFVIYQLELERDLPKTFFLNSVTLTPGTLTVDCKGDRVIIHCFTKENAENVQNWYLYEQMKKVESGGMNNGN